MPYIPGERPSVVARLYFGGKSSASSAWLKKLERDGIIPPAPRTPNGYRFYPLDHIERVREILANGGATKTIEAAAPR